MNILILTGRFGLGHVKAAEAIREEILSADSHTRIHIVDFIDWLFPEAISSAVYSGFSFLTSRCSRVYNYFNKAADRYGRAPFQDALTSKIHRLLSAYQPDLIIATLPFCGQYVSAYKQQCGSQIPLYTYITDLTLHEEWIAAETDLYFVGASATRDALIARGVPSCKIIVSGVPVRQAFRRHNASFQGQPAAREPQKPSAKKFSFRQCRILVMGGGLGMMPGGNQLLSLLNCTPKVSVTLIAGKNHKLAARIRREYPSFRVIGYTNDVARYMKEADLLITKPGGMTTFEAIAVRTPLLVLEPFLEQEKGNARFIEEAGIGYVLRKKDAPAANVLLDILENPEKLSVMQKNMIRLEAGFSPSNALEYFRQFDREKCV